jgi:prephenate dehydrogenase
MELGIVGTGLIGSSVGLAARAAGFRTTGWDSDAEVGARARTVGAIEIVAPSAAEVVGDADVVVVATPLLATLALLRDFPPAPRAVLILDVASVKAPVVTAAGGLAAFVASHPLAGSELTGPEAARADLFQNRVWAYVPPADRTLEARARAFLEALGARAVAVAADRHDALVAFTSHLPQVAATALGSMLCARLDDPLVVELCGGGMRSMTRLAASAWPVWGGVLAANSCGVAQEVRGFADILRSVADALEAGDQTALARRFAQAATAAAALGANEGPPHFVIPGTPTEP